MTNRRVSLSAAAGVFVAALLMSVPVRADEPAAGGKGEFKNLQVLPATTSRKDLTKLMKEWNRALGVKCSACHKDIKTPELDDLELKKTTRAMVKMQQELNKNLATIKPEMAVTCYSCHRGESKVKLAPPAEDAAPAEGEN